MSKKCLDYIGQEVNIGDWCAVTQNNRVHVGKVIKAGSSVTIAINYKEEFMQTDKSYMNLKTWKDKRNMLISKFGSDKGAYFLSGPSWARDGKFVKITPTDKMLMEYDKQG